MGGNSHFWTQLRGRGEMSIAMCFPQQGNPWMIFYASSKIALNFHFFRMIFLMPPQKCTWLSPWGLFFKYPQKCHPIFSFILWVWFFYASSKNAPGYHFLRMIFIMHPQNFTWFLFLEDDFQNASSKLHLIFTSWEWFT